MDDTTMQLHNLNDWPNDLNTLNLNTAKDRQKTLLRWSPGKYLHTDINKIADDGFYYFGKGDTIKCHYCLLMLSKWGHQNDTANDHNTHSKNCPLLQGEPIDNIPLTAMDRTPAYLSYLDNTARENSFQNCDSIKEHAKKLAKDGFFYAGFNDTVICFQCGKPSNDWARGVEAWGPRMMHNDACPLITAREDGQYIINRNDGGQIIINNEIKQQLLMPCAHQIKCIEYPRSPNVCPTCYEIVDYCQNMFLP